MSSNMQQFVNVAAGCFHHVEFADLQMNLPSRSTAFRHLYSCDTLVV
jgi:hypothetical protein